MTIVDTASIGLELQHQPPFSSSNSHTTSEVITENAEGFLKKKRDFFNTAITVTNNNMDLEVDQPPKREDSPKSATANSRSSGFMITDILSNANRGQAAAAAAAAAAALHSRLQSAGAMAGLHPGLSSLTEFHLQQQLQQYHAHQQQQQQQQHQEASSDDGEAISDDETGSSKDAYDQGKLL